MKFHRFVVLLLLIKPACQELMWEELVPATNVRIPRRRDAAIAYIEKENVVYVFGGMSGNKALKDMHKFDLNRRIWEPIFGVDDEGLSGRSSMVFGSNEDYFYIATGQGIRLLKLLTLNHFFELLLNFKCKVVSTVISTIYRINRAKSKSTVIYGVVLGICKTGNIF